MDQVKIDTLANYPQCVSQVVDWLYKEWGDNNFKYWNSWIRNSINNEGIPQTFIIFVNNELAGTYSLWRCDLQSRQDLFPWFGGLYVNPKFRGKIFNGEKLGVLMQHDAINRVRTLGYKMIYLFTEKNTKYYNDNGWTSIGTTFDEKDNQVSLCKYDL